jgi:two-component system OmpR family response regulator
MDGPMTDDVDIDPPLVGVCEDDEQLRGILGRALRAEGLRVVAVATGRQALDRFPVELPNALILDIGLPDADGRDVLQALRAAGVGAPVLFLSARDALTDRVSGFHAGADDYLIKPFALAELLVRLRVLLRRGATAPAPQLETGLILDPASVRATVRQRSVELSPTEFRLLAALAAASGSVVRRRDLIATAWPDGAIVHDNTLDTYLKRLRRHLRDLAAPVEIRTVRGIGYELR